VSLALAWPERGWSRTDEPGTGSGIGFEDTDGDGINLRFRDSNGDGINDVDGRPYPHEFGFEDANGDGINDLWADGDGDGVNDLAGRFENRKGKWADEDGDGIEDEDVRPLKGGAFRKHILDADHDGKNDVTGESIAQMRLKFTGDKLERIRQRRMRMDRFIDRDGDGISDGRGAGNVIRRMEGKKKGKK